MTKPTAAVAQFSFRFKRISACFPGRPPNCPLFTGGGRDSISSAKRRISNFQFGPWQFRLWRSRRVRRIFRLRPPTPIFTRAALRHKRKLQGMDPCSGKRDFLTQKSPHPRRTRGDFAGFRRLETLKDFNLPSRIMKLRKGFRPRSLGRGRPDAAYRRRTLSILHSKMRGLRVLLVANRFRTHFTQEVYARENRSAVKEACASSHIATTKEHAQKRFSSWQGRLPPAYPLRFPLPTCRDEISASMPL